MAKEKYRYNPQTLSYERVQHSTKKKVFISISLVTSFVLLMAFGFILGATLFKSPGEIKALNEKEFVLEKYSELNGKVQQLEEVLADIENRDDNIYRSIFEVSPVPEHQRQMGFGGSDLYKAYEGRENSALLKATAQRIDALKQRMYAQTSSLDTIVKLAKNKEAFLSSIPAIQPVSNKDLTRMASGYGYRIHPIYKVRKMHHGMDFTAPTGTDIYTTGDGVVHFAGRKSGYGNTVVIDHGHGYKTLYAHCSAFKVKKGQKVKRGEVIALVGNTGVSSGAHCHYEVIKNGRKINPKGYFFNDLSEEEYQKLLEKAEVSNQSMD